MKLFAVIKVSRVDEKQPKPGCPTSVGVFHQSKKSEWTRFLVVVGLSLFLRQDGKHKANVKDKDGWIE
jgi:hypothetical protein